MNTTAEEVATNSDERGMTTTIGIQAIEAMTGPSGELALEDIVSINADHR